MRFEIYQQQHTLLTPASGANGDYRWRLRADNGRIVADSGEGYRNRADCEHGINLVKGTTAATPVVDQVAHNALLDALRNFGTNPPKR